MPRGSTTDVDVRREIERLHLQGFKPAVISRHLDRQEEFKGRVPSKRSIEREVQRLAASDPSGRWTLADAESNEPEARDTIRTELSPADARIVLDVLAAVIEMTDGRVWLTRDEAEWVVRVAKAAPTLQPWSVYVFAVQYRVRTQRQEDTSHLDVMLAFRPWESAEAAARCRKYLQFDEAELPIFLIPLLYPGDKGLG